MRYPNLQVKDVVSGYVQKQPDLTSCDVYAADFAMALIVGRNPNEEKFSTDVFKMRKHIFRVIETESILLLPQ